MNNVNRSTHQTNLLAIMLTYAALSENDALLNLYLNHSELFFQSSYAAVEETCGFS